jgi:hypothetical protein
MGRGFSETGLGPGTEEGSFLREDFDGGAFDSGPDGDSDGLPAGLQDSLQENLQDGVPGED